MNTLEIFCKLLSIKGNKNISYDVLAKDQLCNYKVEPPFALCVNTENSNKDGAHWVAIYLGGKNKKIFFFCSFSYPIEFYGNEFMSFTNLHGGKVISNKIQYQAFDSDTCGEFCIVWLLTKICNKNWMTKLSRSDLQQNTFTVKYIVKSLATKNICMEDAKSLCSQICKAYNKFR